MSLFLVLFGLIVIPSNAQNPEDVDRVPKEDEYDNVTGHWDNSQFLRTIYSLLTPDEVALMSPIISDFNATDIQNVSKWQKSQTEHEEAWDHIWSTARTTCDALDLSANECKRDCLYYNSILSWIPLITSNQTEEKAQLQKLIQWYSVSAGPISWFDAGNVDMCQFFEGTYCYTPALTYVTMQHACCIPGSCNGDDAYKVLYTNNWCFLQFKSLYESLGAYVPAVCEPPKRDMKVCGLWHMVYGKIWSPTL